MNKKRLGTFSSLLISYVVTMVVTVCVGAIAYYGSLRVVEKDAEDINFSMLRQSSEVMDARLNEVEGLVDQLSFHPKINAFLNMTEAEEDRDHYMAIDTWNYVQSYRFTSRFIANFYIYFNNSRIIMSPADMSRRMPMYYENMFRYKGMTFEQWSREFTDKFHNGEYVPAHSITINGRTDSYITYLQTVPLGFRNNFEGTIMVLIPETEIHQLFSRLNLQNGGWSIIADASGTVITSMTDGNRTIDMAGMALEGTTGTIEQRLNGEQMLISYYTSPVNKWRYVSAIPTRVVMQKVAYMKRTNAYIIAAGLLIGLLMAMYFTYRNNKPLSRLMVNNEALQLAIEKQAPLLRAAVMDRLLRGEFNDDREAEAAAIDIGIARSGTDGAGGESADGGAAGAGLRFCVAVLRMDRMELQEDRESREKLEIERIIMKDSLQSSLGNSAVIHDLGQEKMALLFLFPQEHAEAGMAAADRAVTELCQQFNKQSAFHVACGMGNVCDQLQDVYRSFKEAGKALEWVNIGRGEVSLRYDHIPQDDPGYSYPLEVEQRLMNLVKSGNEEETRKLLEAIHDETIAARMRSPDSVKLLMYDLAATVHKLNHEVAANREGEEPLHGQPFIEYVGALPTFHDAYKAITNALIGLCRQASSQKKSHNFDLKLGIIDYIDRHYQDGNLGLANAAQAFGISEVYLSQFFKEQTGENFSNYMERKRMSHARELLRTTSLTIDEIAGRVGYFNTNTFYKAFKRIEGISPGAFRGGKNT